MISRRRRAVELWETRNGAKRSGEFSKSCEQAVRTVVCAHGLVIGRHFHSQANLPGEKTNMLTSSLSLPIQTFNAPFSLVENAYGHRAEMQEPAPLAKRFQTDALALERTANAYFAAMPFDLSQCFDLARAPRYRIVGHLRQAARKAKRARRVERSGSFVIERFVRPLVIELEAKTIENFLLRTCGSARRSRGFGLQRAMHSLVPTVVLRLSGTNAVVADSEANPPDRQARKPLQASRRERRTVVGADRLWQAELAKSRLEKRSDFLGAGFSRHGLATQDEARVAIGDGQRRAARAIATPESAASSRSLAYFQGGCTLPSDGQENMNTYGS